MGSHRIAVIPGDGIGPEVIQEGLRALKALSATPGLSLEFEEFPWGSDFYLRKGRMMPEDALERLSGFHAIYLGAVGDPRVPDHESLSGLLLPLRRGFDQYVCQRPARLLPGAPCPLKGFLPGEIDMIIFRENTEGEYAPVGGRLYPGTREEVVVQSGVFTRRGTERIMRYAFEEAARRPRRHLTSVTKSNAQAYSMVFWDEVFEEVGSQYPAVTREKMLVDAACMNLVRKPQAFDVIVASNLFGDILTDLAAALVGGLGLAPSANLNPERRFPSMFEPVHGSAPDIAGRGIANPLAALLTAALMLDFLGEAEAARRLEGAVEEVLQEGRVLTPDLGGSSPTRAVSDAVIARL